MGISELSIYLPGPATTSQPGNYNHYLSFTAVETDVICDKALHTPVDEWNSDGQTLS